MTTSLQCPDCNSDRVTLAHIQTFMANTLEHYCHSVKVQDSDSPSRCLECDWRGQHDQLQNYGNEEQA
jgi:hypothetical protein